jgi:phenylacetate-CoA ligase
MNIDKFIRKNFTIPLWLFRHGMIYSKELNLVNALHAYTIDELREYQLRRIQLLLDYAYQNVPFYRSEWKRIGMEPRDIRTFDDFHRIPILTKPKLRENADELLSSDSRNKKLVTSGTGGTTDSPIVLYYDYSRARMKEAEMQYFRKWFRWEVADKVAFLWGAPQDIPNIRTTKYKIINRLTQNKLYLFSSLMDESIMNDFVERLNRFKPDILQGYSNPTYILATHVLECGAKVHSPKSIVLTAEPCLPHQRKIIESAFNSEVFTFYGCREGGYVGCECSKHIGYHINCTSIYMEFLTEKGPARQGELGNIVFTDLYNFDMPFIRYQIGDLGIPTDTMCSCGSKLPMMEFFAGRETDVFITPDGEFIPGVSLCDRIIEDCRGIEQMQFIQNKSSELIVNIVKGKDFSDEDLRQLDTRLNMYFKGRLEIIKKFVNGIPKEKSGKTRFCISNVQKRL